MKTVRIGSRGSALALWQANFVRASLAERCGIESEILVIKTSGDRFPQAEIASIGVKGVFIKEIEDALLRGDVDLAVHSMKDVPATVPEGLTFPAICQRDDPRDCLVSRSGAGLNGLPAGARVGTSSVRRQAQLRRLRPDLQLVDLRGNVDTRLRKLDEGQYEAIVVAKAGLDRLGWGSRITEVLSPEVCLPAVAQGALGIEARSEDAELLKILSALDHAETHTAIAAERALLEEVQGGCQLPLGGWARMEAESLILDGAVFSLDGTSHTRDRIAGHPATAAELGRKLARNLFAAGGDAILKLAGRAIGND